MTTKAYEVEITQPRVQKSREWFPDIWRAMNYIASFLNNISCLMYLNKGSFPENILGIDKKSYYKKYKIDVDVLGMTISLKKLTTGNIDQSLVVDYLENLRRLYERINNQSRLD